MFEVWGRQSIWHICMHFSLERTWTPRLPPPSLPTTASHSEAEESEASEGDHLLPSEEVKNESRAKLEEPLQWRFQRAAKTVLSPAMLLLLIGGSIRQAPDSIEKIWHHV